MALSAVPHSFASLSPHINPKQVYHTTDHYYCKETKNIVKQACILRRLRCFMQQSSSTRTYLILAVQSGLFVINWEQKHTSKIQI